MTATEIHKFQRAAEQVRQADEMQIRRILEDIWQQTRSKDPPSYSNSEDTQWLGPSHNQSNVEETCDLVPV
jgi:hypothetical protein